MPANNSVLRAARILRHLAQADGPVSLTDIGHALAIPKSTAHNILAALVEEQFTEVTTSGGYTIGLAAFEVGASHLRSADAGNAVRPELVRLTRNLDMTSHWAVVNGTDAVYLGKEDPPGLHIRLASALGARLPAHTTAVGKSCLAWLPGEQRAQHLPEDISGSDRVELEAELARVRQRGYSTDDGLSARGVMCLAAPVRGVEGVRGAIGVSYLHDDDMDVATIAGEVMAVADRASILLGGSAAS